MPLSSCLRFISLPQSLKNGNIVFVVVQHGPGGRYWLQIGPVRPIIPNFGPFSGQIEDFDPFRPWNPRNFGRIEPFSPEKRRNWQNVGVGVGFCPLPPLEKVISLVSGPYTLVSPGRKGPLDGVSHGHPDFSALILLPEGLGLVQALQLEPGAVLQQG